MSIARSHPRRRLGAAGAPRPCTTSPPSAGVSIRTVSRVVNDRPGPALAHTGPRAPTSSSELGYRPNLLARGLVTRQSFTLGLIATYLIDPFFSRAGPGHPAGRAIGTDTSSSSPAPRVTTTASSTSSTRSSIVGCDGLIVFPVRGSQDQLRERRSPRRSPSSPSTTRSIIPRIGSVESDTEGGAHLAVEHLRSGAGASSAWCPARAARPSTSHANAASARPSPTVTDDVRPPRRVGRRDDGRRGRRRAPTARRGSPTSTACLPTTTSWRSGRSGRSRTSAATSPTTWRSIGVDDVALSALVRPALTTVRIDREQMGARAVDMLMQIARDPHGPPRRETVDVSLVRRDSA